MTDAGSGERQLASPSRVSALQLVRDDEGLSLSLQLAELNGTRSFTFSGVTDLRFRSEKTELLGIALMLVEDVSASGWEGIRFRVRDAEEAFVSFFCRDFVEM